MAQFEVRELSPALGAEIVGLDLNDWLDDETIAALRKVFDDRGLVLFRDVDIDRAYQFYLCECLWGHEPPSPEEAEAGAIAQGNFTISNKVEDAAAPFGRLLFHSDGMWSAEPYEMLSLYGVEVEEPVFPTLFASAANAWDLLPEDLRDRLQGMHALHVTGPEYIHERRRKAFEGELSQARRDFVPLITQKVGYEHPRTGRPLLYVSQGMTREIMELGADESEDLLEELFDYLYGEGRVYEHYWREGDLCIWDNLAVQHGRPNVRVEGPARTLQKVGLPVPTNVAVQLVATYADVDS